MLAVVLAVLGGASRPAVAAKESPSPSPSPAPTATPDPPDVAIPKLQARLKINPNDQAALIDLDGQYLQISRPDLALQTSGKLLSIGIKTGQVYSLDGYANLMLGRAPQATADLEQASNLEPTNLSVLSTLTGLYLRQNRLADAERIAKRALTFNKDDKRAYLNYGQVLEAEQKYDEARQQYDTAAKMDPKDVEPILAEAATYLAQNAVALASSLYDRALAIDPNSEKALYGKAQILAGEHNVREAIATYERLRSVVADSDSKADILRREAQLYAAEKMDAEADTAFKNAIAQYPDARVLHVAYGDYFAQKNDLASAESQWTAALGPNRDDADALGRLGSDYADKKDYPKALDYLKRLVEVAPNESRGWAVLGSVYSEQHDWKNAHDAFRHAYDLTRTPQMLIAVGESDLNLRNYKEAQQIFEAIDKGAPDYVKQDPRIIFLLAQSYDKLGMEQPAKVAYQRFLAYLKPGTPAYTQVRKMIDDIDHRKPAAKK
ncbi:MAG: tetratricopeptide repeat protein [Candidatus Eremiobacteraeota bacterium]|nr:tetratricopeptide repeat protein [Candidatus Eremiobacteraeota bacterium]